MAGWHTPWALCSRRSISSLEALGFVSSHLSWSLHSLRTAVLSASVNLLLAFSAACRESKDKEIGVLITRQNIIRKLRSLMRSALRVQVIFA